MSPAQNHSQLDAFIRETLKHADEKIQPIDWSEVEILIKPTQRAIPVQVSKKTIVIAAAVIGGLLLLFGIVKIAQHYSSLPPPAESETLIDSTQTTLAPVDTIIIQEVIPQTDSTAFFAAEKAKADSVAAVALADSLAAAQKTTEKPIIVPVKPKQEKKKKSDSTQKTSAPDTIIPQIIPDTVSKPAPQEVIPATPATPDTASNTTSPKNNTVKKKKEKPKKAVPPPAEQSAPPEIKPDSLKQQ